MSKIFKASNIQMDTDKTVVINVPEASSFAREVEEHALDKEENEKDSENQQSVNFEQIKIDAETLRDKILSDANNEAEKIVSSAETKAAAIVAEANLEADAIRLEAENSGMKKGYDSGFKKGFEDAESIKEEANAVYENALVEREDLINSVEPDMIDLVTQITQKLLYNAVDINPQIIINLIQQGLHEATITGDVRILVSKDDYDEVIKNRDEIIKSVEGGANVEFVKDFSLAKSDCIIETPFGNVDCSLDRQFESLVKDLIFIFNANVGKDKWV